MWHTVASLNLFHSRLANEEDVVRQRWTTRLFIFLMVNTVAVIGVYIFFSVQPQLITVSHPSLEIYNRLYNNYSTTLSCPCSRISIPYKKFLTIEYTLHQICSSTLVSASWLDFILSYPQSETFQTLAYLVDFRSLAPSYFQLLVMVCSLIHNTLDDALITLGENHYINQYLPSRSAFVEQMRLLNESSTTSIQQEFLSLENWLHLMTTESQLFVGLSLNGYLEENGNDDVVDIVLREAVLLSDLTETDFSWASTCSCLLLPTDCQFLTLLYEVNSDRFYPHRNFVGMSGGCIPWLGLLVSDTTWWHRTDIIDQIRLLFNDHLRNLPDPIIIPLSNYTQTRFRLTDGSHPLFEDLLKQALLEQWTGDLTRFDLFYEECAPSECTYLIQSQRSRLAALLLLISICGGLNKLLRWFSLIMLRLVFYLRNRYRHQRDRGKMILMFMMRCNMHLIVGEWRIIGNMRRSLIELNLYRSRSIEVSHIQREQRQTRLYLCLLSIAVVVLISYTSSEEHAVVETINPPSDAAEYEQLRGMYGDTLECPCSRISLEYNIMIPKLKVESLHPICNSSFVTSKWYANYASFFDITSKRRQDFARVLVPLFRLISALCSLARDQISNNLVSFLSSTRVVNRVISTQRFEQRLNSTIIQLQQQIPAQFAQNLDLIRLSQQGNGLISAFGSNWEYLVRNNNRTIGAFLTRRSLTYENGTCSCALSPKCSMPATMFTGNDEVFFTSKTLRLGCTILETVLQSSLECFYSKSCFALLIDGWFLDHPWIDPSIWNMSQGHNAINHGLSTFAENDTMETIVSRMFINRWEHELSYEGFFRGCATRECTYTRHYRFDVLDIVTTFLSVFGGLSIGLHFLVPYLFLIMAKIRSWR